MFADMSATSGPKDPGARESAVSGAKPLIEGVPFNAMPYMIARVRCKDTKGNGIRRLSFEIDLAYHRTKDYKPYFLVEVYENEKARLHFGLKEYREYNYYFKNVADGVTHHGSGLSNRPINPTRPLKTLSEAADAIKWQFNYELPGRSTPESSADSDALIRNLKALSGIMALSKAGSGSKAGLPGTSGNLLRATES